MFSQPDVIRRVQADFVPVALKAGQVQNPGDDEEGRLYREIARSRPAPQGIAIANSDGRVLGWALSFRDSASVGDFLDRAVKRYARFPNAAHPSDTVRFMKYPDVKLDDVEDAAAPVPAAGLAHSAGSGCPATPPVPKGTLLVRITGRALGADGKPLADTARQDQYIEDRLEIPLRPQEAFVRAVSNAAAERWDVPEELARPLVGHAFLGQLDVNPAIQGKAPACQLSAKKVGEGLYLLEGWSELSGGETGREGNARTDGRQWRHEVTLTWKGLLEVRDSRVARISLVAQGREKLTWGNAGVNYKEEDVAHLPAGRAIDFDGAVRYGVRTEVLPK